MDASKKRRRTRRVQGSGKITAGKAVTPEQKEPEVQIVYTPAKPFNRKWFVLRLATVAAVVLALILACPSSLRYKM